MIRREIVEERHHLYVLAFGLRTAQSREQWMNARNMLKELGSIVTVANSKEGFIRPLFASGDDAGVLKERLSAFDLAVTEVQRGGTANQRNDANMMDQLTALSPPSTEAAAHRILFADDSQIARDLYRIFLQRNGFDVEVATDGEEALHLLRNGRFSAVITDDLMPAMDGIELARQVRGDKENGRIPIIVISGQSNGESRERAVTAGANAYLVKGDFAKEQLLEVLNNELRGNS